MFPILITNINSLLGWSLFEEFKTNKHVYFLRRKNILRAERHERVFCLDWENKSDLNFILKLAPKVIIHTKAICDLDTCEAFPDLAQRMNVDLLKSLIDLCKRIKGFQKFVHISPDHVFSGDEGSYSEEDSPHPKHVYGRTKLESEQILQQSDLPWLLIRHGLLLGSSGQGNKGPLDFMLSRLRQDKPVTLFCDETRSIVSANFVVQQIGTLLDRDASGIVHLTSNIKMNRFDLGVQLAQLFGADVSLIQKAFRKDCELSSIRPKDLSLKSERWNPEQFNFLCFQESLTEELYTT